jgi:hypothetical protein
MNYKEIMEILKEFGNKTGYVWLSNSISRKCIMLKYDSTRRYFMSQITDFRDFDKVTTAYFKGDNKPHVYTKWNKRPSLQRVSKDTFKSNVEYLLQHGYSICF